MTGDTNRGVEAVKWLAFVLMVLDHATIFLTDERPGWAYLLGRLVFPLFVMALGHGLSKAGRLAFDASAGRLLVWACVAQVPFAMLIPGVVLNVLFTFWAGVTLYALVAFRQFSALRVLLALGAILATHAVEFGPIGVALVVTAIGHARAEDVVERRVWLGGFWGALTLLHAVNGVPVAMLAPLVYWAVVKWVEVPRWRHGFYYLYPAQFAAIVAARAAL